MKLSDHFMLSEFTASQTASRLGIDNTPNYEQIQNMQALCDHVLEPLREHCVSPVFITSGYRSPALNSRIGGSTRSQHTLGEAADIHVAGRSNLHIAEWIRDNLAFDHLILEYWRPGDPRAGWIHVSWTRNRELRRGVLNVDARFPGNYKSGLPSL